MTRGTAAAAVSASGGAAWLGYYPVATGKLRLDAGGGGGAGELGRFGVEIAAPAGTVFDVITAPYLGRTPRALAAKLRVIQRGEGMVLAEHYTPVHGGWLTATTLET